MGYYSQFKLEVRDPDSAFIKKVNDEEGFLEFHDAATFELMETAEGEPLLFTPHDSYKWYDHIEHMLDLSYFYPRSTFVLDVHGEELGDVQRYFFRRGRIAAYDLYDLRPKEPREEDFE